MVRSMCKLVVVAAAFVALVLPGTAAAARVDPQVAGLQVALRAYGLYGGPIDGGSAATSDGGSSDGGSAGRAAPCPSGVLDGSYTIETNEDAVAIAGCTEITGALSITGDVTTVSLPLRGRNPIDAIAWTTAFAVGRSIARP